MNKWKSMKILILVLMIFVLIKSPWAVERVEARGSMWQVLEFDSGQRFTYDLKRGTKELETVGEVTFWVSDSQDDMIRLIVKANFNGETFTASAPGKAGDIESIIGNFMGVLLAELPYEVNEVLTNTIFISPWLEIPIDEIELTSGHQEYITDANEDTYLLKILNNRGKYVGLEGYLIQIESEEENVNIEMCVNPELPLPLTAVTEMVAEEDRGIFAVELTNYTTGSDVPEWEKRRAAAESELLKVVEHFRTNNIQIGERKPKSYKMMGAVEGFGLEVEGGEIELYIFDPETAEEDILTGLNEARDTGDFYSPSFNMEIPVVINCNIMLTGLEYGSHYSHPAKDKVIEVFKSF